MKYASWILSLLVSIALHVFMGWSWSIAGAVLVGALQPRLGWLAGGTVLTLSWGLLIGSNFFVAPKETFNMINTVAQLIGDLPGFVTVAATLMIAFVLGSASGWLGAAITQKRSSKK
ncbi:MAG: hypothetical protein O2797_08835 [Bacteroidetes bacterium]|nr:hypothetical protein [Bacteroidota bacterium]MDA1334310.1 hypothetical protein [Bacteroidota bacterium]